MSRAFKSTGDAWCPSIPDDWDYKPLRRLGMVVGGGTPTAEPSNWDGDVPFVTPPDLRVVSGATVSTTERHVTALGAATGSAVVPANSVLVSIRAPIGYVARTALPVAFNQGCRALVPNERIDSRYLTYALLAAGQELLAQGRGTTFMEVSGSQFASVRCPVPSIEEQRTIVQYLERETAKIDALIAEQEGLLAVSRERRRALISHVVASGMNRAAPKERRQVGAVMLDVPAHWTVLPLRYTLRYQEGPGILAVDFRDEGVPLLRISGVKTAEASLEGCNYLDPEMVDGKWSHFRVALGDLLISASASMGTVSKVTSDDVVGAVPYTGIIKITPGAMLEDFIRWFVVSNEFIEQVEALKTGSTIQHFGPSHLSQMRVALPTPDEQRLIASFLDEQTEKIDGLIAEAEGMVAVAKERRSALVAAAVTGRIDVRGEVA